MLPDVFTHLEGYEFRGVLGTGGFGSVYRAVDRLGREVAIKVLTLEADEGPEKEASNRSFLKEATTLAKLNHPNIVTIYSFDIASTGRPYLVMEFLPGEPLSKIIRSGGRLHLVEKLAIILQAAKALQFAHKARPQPVIHRDIKPHNLMVMADLSVKLIDFGIAQVTGAKSRTMASDIIGSLPYMSPEHWQLPFTPWGDVFSLGVVCFELLTGTVPFATEQDTVPVAYQKIVSAAPAPLLMQFLPDVPVGLEEVMAKVLSKQKASGYEDAQQFWLDLSRVYNRIRSQFIAERLEEAIAAKNAGYYESASNLAQRLMTIDSGNHDVGVLQSEINQALKRSERGLKEASDMIGLVGLPTPDSERVKAFKEYAVSFTPEQLVIDVRQTEEGQNTPGSSMPPAQMEQALKGFPGEENLRHADSSPESVQPMGEFTRIFSSPKKPESPPSWAAPSVPTIWPVPASPAISAVPALPPAPPIPSISPVSVTPGVSVPLPIFVSPPISIPPPIPVVPLISAGSETLTFTDPSNFTKMLASDAAAGKEKQAPHAGPSFDFTRMFGGVPPAPVSSSLDVEFALPKVRLMVTATSDSLLLGKSVPIDSVPFRIGRNGELAIADALLSREHAVIDWDGNSFEITDCRSSNGTFVNGKQIRSGKQPLPFGAIIRLGTATALIFSSDELTELPDLTGQEIADRYTLTKLLRNGSKTALYEASDSRLPQLVAIKVLSPSLARYRGYRDHFNREAETAVRLRHPHICRVYDYGVARVRVPGGQTLSINYLSMELMEGGSLADRLTADTPVPWEQVVVWLDHITSALDSAHRQGVAHGGLKPSAIVFDRDGAPYVADFAMAYRGDDQSKHFLLGSPEFLAPEQWEGVTAASLADQYSLAALTYLVLTGICPFEGQHDPKVRERNFLRGSVPVHDEAARMGRPAIPKQASKVLGRALSTKSEDRYTSVREFFLALQEAFINQTFRAAGNPRIFISYQRDASSGWAAYFASELKRHDIVVFVDTQRQDTAVRFPARLKKAIEECDVFICLLSDTTLQSKWVQEEIRLAWEADKPMVPVFQEGYPEPDPSERLEPHIETLISYEGVRLFDRQNVYVEHAIAKVAEMVTSSVSRGRAGG